MCAANLWNKGLSRPAVFRETERATPARERTDTTATGLPIEENPRRPFADEVFDWLIYNYGFVLEKQAGGCHLGFKPLALFRIAFNNI